jgi:hypothetical protein
VVFFRIDGGGDHLVVDPVPDEDVVCVSELVLGATVAEPEQ